MSSGSSQELLLPEARLPFSRVHLYLLVPPLSPGCHPHHHACLQELFRYVFPAVHFNSTEVSGSEIEYGHLR
jgi:hypothetical protein